MDSRDSRYNIPISLHHTQSASTIPHYNNNFNSPHFNINMNGHTHHVGGHSTQGQNQSFNNLNLKQIYNQPNGAYQSVGYVPTGNIYQQQQQYGSINSGQFNGNQGNISQMSQNFGVGQQGSTQFGHLNNNQHQQNNNFAQLTAMSNQHNLNPSNMPLGGYHNQGYGSHTTQPQNPAKKT
jgi:hypothetical protein